MAKQSKMDKARKRAEELAKRRKEESRSSGGGNKSYAIPDGMQLFKLQGEGSKVIDILPFEAGPNNPLADEGTMTGTTIFHQHGNIGPNKDRVLCPFHTLGKDCPICEYVAELREDYDENKDTIKAIAAKKRYLYQLVDHEEPGKVKLWETSGHVFTELLDKVIDDADDVLANLYFDPELGKSIKLSYSSHAIGSNSYSKVDLISLKERDASKKPKVTEKVLDQVVCLDEQLKELPYSDLKSMLFGNAPAEDEGEDEKPKKKKDKKKKKDAEPEPAEEPTPSKKKKKDKKKKKQVPEIRY